MATSFGADSTADDVLDRVLLTNKRILVTGASSGLGVETARSLAAHGATVIGAARDLVKARAATERARAEAAHGGALELIELDLASLRSVRGCAQALLGQGQHIDCVIANAGVMACPAGRTEDGFDVQFGTNHLGHFVLVNRLIQLFKPGSRVVCVSSAAHGFSDVDLDDPNFERTPYHELIAYGRSKTANVLFVVEFDRIHRAHGVRAIAVHPGAIRTALMRHITPEVARRLRGQDHNAPPTPGPEIVWKSISQGAATSVWAATVAAGDEAGGRYCADCRVSGVAQARSYVGNDVQPYAIDPQRARALWAKSEAMVGQHF